MSPQVYQHITTRELALTYQLDRVDRELATLPVEVRRELQRRDYGDHLGEQLAELAELTLLDRAVSR